MDLTDYDTRGRAVAQYFVTELEKIAVSSGLARASADEAQRRAGELGKRLGLKRFIPFTRESQAHAAAKLRASRLAQAADAKRAAERQALLDKTRATGRITQQDMVDLQNLQDSNGKLDRLWKKQRIGSRKNPPEREGVLSDPRARGAAAAVGLPLAGAGTLYAGQQYLQSQQDPYGGY